MPANQPGPSAAGKAAGGPSGRGGTLGQEENEQQNGKTGVTQAELDAMERRFEQRLARQYQGIQSMIDRQSGSLKAANETFGRFSKTLEKLGVKLTDEQSDALREAETLHAMSQADGDNGEPEPEPGDGTGAQPKGRARQIGTFGDLALRMMQERGVMISANDPELEEVDQETQDPKVFMDSFEAALDAKVLRVARERRLGGLEPEPGTEEAETETGAGGPKLNPRGRGTPRGKLLPDKRPSGERTTPGDYLSAGYEESGVFPTGE